MAGEFSARSGLIDVTCSQLHAILSGRQEGIGSDQISHYLGLRKHQLSNVLSPFGKPLSESKRKVESGSIVLEDGVTIRVENADKEFVFAISDKFNIDEVQALILLRSFLYNEGLPPTADDSSTSSMIAELLEAITPFYHSERLFLLRIFLPLFRAREDSSDPLYDIACEMLTKLIPDGVAFADNLLTTYEQKLKDKIPEPMQREPRTATRWAKQNSREQLTLLEVLFWTMWGYVPCTGSMVARIYEVAYGTNLGSSQKSATFLLDDEGEQLRQDCAAMWMFIMIEILELESLADPDTIEISDDPANKDIYTASPTSLQRIHELVISHSDSQHVMAYLGWAFVISRLSAKASQMQQIPSSYRPFFDLAGRHTDKHTKTTESAHTLMARSCLTEETGLFRLIRHLLTASPLFVTAVAWRTGSSVTDPNAIAFRSVLKGLLISLVELTPVELIPDLDGLIDVWVTLFGRSESQSIAGICAQFWQSDWHRGISRRAIFDVARSRFPIQIQPLVRLLRAMTAAGFLDTDELSTSDYSNEGDGLTDERYICVRHVFYYFENLPTYTQVIPVSACGGAHALYERVQERYNSANGHSASGLVYHNLRPLKLPGGSILPVKSCGRLLSGDGSDHVVVSWQHHHSGWKIVLEVLTDYVNRRLMQSGSGTALSFKKTRGAGHVTLRLEDVGVEMAEDGDEVMITDCLDLVRSLVQDNPEQAEQLMRALESGEPVVAHTMTETQPPDLVQLTIMILEEAMSRSDPRHRSPARTQLITSAMSVLSALLALPHYSNRVWLFLRSTTALFSSEKAVGLASVALAVERATGHYTMTLALLHLVQQLFREASSFYLPADGRLQQLKEEVLLRAARFVHTEIWIEHLGWKYAQLGDRFEIGRRVAALYISILEYSSPNVENRPFASLSQCVVDAFLLKASSSTLHPLVTSIASGRNLLRGLYATRRYGEARRLLFLLQSCLRLTRMVLDLKLKSVVASKPCLLEQALCTLISGSAASLDSRAKLDPIDVLAVYVKDRDVGTTVPVEAARVLSSLCSCLSAIQPPPTTIIGHLSNPEAMVASMVRIIQHPYDEMALRNAVWNFISLAVDKEPALAGLFVTGEFHTPGDWRGKSPTARAKGKKKEVTSQVVTTNSTSTSNVSALNVAKDVLVNWKDMSDANPQLLASVLKFVDVVWRHGLEHKAALEPLRQNTEFWKQLVGMVKEDLGPHPDFDVSSSSMAVDGIQHSDGHETVAAYAYHTLAKSYAINIISLDIGNELQQKPQGRELSKASAPLSFRELESSCFREQEKLHDLLLEAAPTPYLPGIYDDVLRALKASFDGLDLEQLRIPDSSAEREFGDHFTYSVALLKNRLRAYLANGEENQEQAVHVERLLMSVNLNLSLTYAQVTLTESCQALLRQATPYLRGDDKVRPNLLAITSSISFAIAEEKLSGDMMASIHGTRLSLLLATLELAWFSAKDSAEEIKSFIEVVRNVHDILLSEAQPPANSFLGRLSKPFHGVLLQIVYFCTRQGRSLARRPKTLKADQRLTLLAMVEASLNLVIDALQVVFISARAKGDVELDKDMELLVAVFEQCTRKDLNPSSTLWLGRCQETDIIRSSLDLYTHLDLVGLSDLPLLVSRKQPLYVPHILLFHMALVSHPTAAERFANEGVLAAYSNNSISGAISAGLIDVTLPELPGERSPAHNAYCSMLAIVAAVISSLGISHHYFDAEAAGVVQLFGNQISRALSWTVGDTITWPLLEEMEQVVTLFYSIATNTPGRLSKAHPAVEKLLRAFTVSSLKLLQQVNYAITHPNHLASLLEAVTLEERAALEREQTAAQAGLDPLKRPLVLQLMYRLFKLSSNILETLLTVSRADTVLLSPQDDWPLQEAVVVPHSKVVPGEPASMGTLLELGNCTIDVLRDLVNRPAGQSIVPVGTVPPRSSDTGLDVRQGVLTARRNLETMLTYAVTQLAMWLLKPDFEPIVSSGESMALDGGVEDERIEGKEHRLHARPSASLAERVRRGMTGEIAADLQALITKAKPIIEKSDGALDPSGKVKSVDLTDVLAKFLQERMRLRKRPGMTLLQPRAWKHAWNSLRLYSRRQPLRVSLQCEHNRNSSSSPVSEDDIPDFGDYSVILPPEPFVFGVSHIAPRLVPSHIRRPAYASAHPMTREGKEHISRSGSDEKIVLGGESEVRIREAAKLARTVREYAGSLVQAGITTNTIDAAIHEFIIAHNAYPSPLHYHGFPRSCCTSVNNIMVHGIPDDRPLEDGDIINVDITVYLNGYHGDTSQTFLVGQVDLKGRSLVAKTALALHAGILACGPGRPYKAIGRAIHDVVRKSRMTANEKFSISPQFSGHGIGTDFHTPPWIVHDVNDEPGVMVPGDCFTIEPCIVQGKDPTGWIFPDGWTTSTESCARSAQAEHMVLITEAGVDVLTK
ncbi:hypothetical protein APHAL10511_008023 [Amanita phalloides]|nr:hypothetical protein APHAL10511_008023 [Amanita phalloides]